MIIDIVNIDFEMISNISDSLFSKLSKFFVFAKIQFQIIKNDLVLKILNLSGQRRTVLFSFEFLFTAMEKVKVG